MKTSTLLLLAALGMGQAFAQSLTTGGVVYAWPVLTPNDARQWNFSLAGGRFDPNAPGYDTGEAGYHFWTDLQGVTQFRMLAGPPPFCAASPYCSFTGHFTSKPVFVSQLQPDGHTDYVIKGKLIGTFVDSLGITHENCPASFRQSASSEGVFAVGAGGLNITVIDRRP